MSRFGRASAPPISAEAHNVIEFWIGDYNYRRSHPTGGGRTPGEAYVTTKMTGQWAA